MGSCGKCTKITWQPRFIIRQAATGESMPPDMSAATRPPVPTGRPPGPGISRRYNNTSRGVTSTKMLTSGSRRLTLAPVSRSTRLPSLRLSSSEVRGNALSDRLAVMRKVEKLRPSVSLSSAASMASSERGTLRHL